MSGSDLIVAALQKPGVDGAQPLTKRDSVSNLDLADLQATFDRLLAGAKEQGGEWLHEATELVQMKLPILLAEGNPVEVVLDTVRTRLRQIAATHLDAMNKQARQEIVNAAIGILGAFMPDPRIGAAVAGVATAAAILTGSNFRPAGSMVPTGIPTALPEIPAPNAAPWKLVPRS